MPNCQFWNCGVPIKDGHFLCFDHFQESQSGQVNNCPRCGKFKYMQYQLCLPCSQGESVSQAIKIEHDASWEKNDAKATEWYVYILKINGETRFYAGHTRDFEERMMEHNEGKVPSTKGKNPRLYYFERHPSRVAAESREVELKVLVANNEREVRKIITKFQNYVEWVNKISEIYRSEQAR